MFVNAYRAYATLSAQLMPLDCRHTLLLPRLQDILARRFDAIATLYFREADSRKTQRDCSRPSPA